MPVSRNMASIFQFVAGCIQIFTPGVVNDAQGKCVCKNCETQTDSSQAKNCEGFAWQIMSLRTNPVRLPFSLSDGMFGQGKLSKCREQEVQSRDGSCIVYN